MKRLIKNLVTAVLSFTMVISVFCSASYAGVPTASQMAERIEDAKLKWSENSTYNKYVCSRCGYKAWQCYGFSTALTDYLFGGECTHSWPTHKNINLLCVGDIVRINSDTHSIVITGISGNTITYVDGNRDYDLKVHWNHTISRSDLSKKMTYIRSNRDNEIFTLDEINKSVSAAVTGAAVAAISNSGVVVNGGTYIINSVYNGKPLNCYVWNIGDVRDMTKINTYDRYEGDLAQRFTLEANGNAYNIKTQAQGYFVNIMSRYTQGNQAIAYDSNKDIEPWIITKCGSGYAIVLKNNTSMALTVGSDGNVTLNTYTGSNNQQWTFERV